MTNLQFGGERSCSDHQEVSETKFIVLTGGPGAGKTAVLEILRKLVCDKTAILPESASIIYGGGFWRLESRSARVEAQAAIFQTQLATERLVRKEKKWFTALCDRGTLDGLAYWPESEHLFWKMLRTSHQEELDRYLAVIHLQCPTERNGYNHQNPIRIESAEEAARIDAKIERIWSAHPNYHQVSSTRTFFEKAHEAIQVIAKDLPKTCQEDLRKGVLNGIQDDHGPLSRSGDGLVRAKRT